MREYWMVDLHQKKVLVYFFETLDEKESPVIYGLQDRIPIMIYNGDLTVDMSVMLPWAEAEYPE